QPGHADPGDPVLLGPLILAAVVAGASAAAALLVVGGLAAGGAFVLAAMMATPERPQGRTARQFALRSSGVRIALAVTVLFAVVLGATEVGIPALSDERGVPAVSGLLLAAISVGGILGAIWYGSPGWSAGPAATLVGLLALLTLAIGALIGTPPFPAIWLPPGRGGRPGRLPGSRPRGRWVPRRAARSAAPSPMPTAPRVRSWPPRSPPGQR